MDNQKVRDPTRLSTTPDLLLLNCFRESRIVFAYQESLMHTTTAVGVRV